MTHRLGIISLSLGLKLEKSLLTSSIRCIIQLTIMVINIHCIQKNPFL